MEQGFEEWKKTHSSFRSIEDPQSNDNSFWQHNSIQLEKEVEFYRNRFNDARTCLVTNRVAVDELAKVREREKTEMELQYEVEMNGIRKDTIDKIEKYQHRHVLIDEEKRRMLAELDYLRLQRENEEAAAKSGPQRPVYDHELRELLLSSGFLKIDRDAKENQEQQTQLRSELKTLADRIRDIEVEGKHKESSWNKEKETYAILQKTITNRTKEMQSDFDSRLQALQTEWAKSKEEALRLRHKLDEEKAKKETLKNQLSQLNHTLTDERIKNGAKHSHKEVNLRLQKLNQEKAELERKLARCESDKENSQQKLYEEKKGFLDKMQSVEKEKMILEKKLLDHDVDERKLKRLKSDLSSKDEEIEKIRAQLQLAENAQRRCRDSEECLYLENEQLRNDLIALTLELSKQRSQQNKDQAEMFRQLAGEENAKNDEIMKLRQQIAAYEKTKQPTTKSSTTQNDQPSTHISRNIPHHASLRGDQTLKTSSRIGQCRPNSFSPHGIRRSGSLYCEPSPTNFESSSYQNLHLEILGKENACTNLTKPEQRRSLESKTMSGQLKNKKKVTFARKTSNEPQSYDYELQTIFSSAEQRKSRKLVEAHSGIRKGCVSPWWKPQDQPFSSNEAVSKIETEELISAIHRKTVNKADQILEKIYVYQNKHI